MPWLDVFTCGSCNITFQWIIREAGPLRYSAVSSAEICYSGILLLLLLFETGFPCIVLETPSVDQAGFEITEIHQPLPLSARIKDMGLHFQAKYIF